MKFKYTCEGQFRPIYGSNQGTAYEIDEHLKMQEWQTVDILKIFSLFVLPSQLHGNEEGEKEIIMNSNECNLLSA